MAFFILSQLFLILVPFKKAVRLKWAIYICIYAFSKDVWNKDFSFCKNHAKMPQDQDNTRNRTGEVSLREGSGSKCFGQTGSKLINDHKDVMRGNITTNIWTWLTKRGKEWCFLVTHSNCDWTFVSSSVLHNICKHNSIHQVLAAEEALL